MKEIVVAIISCVLIFAFGIYVFNGGGGMKNQVTTGYTHVTTTLRTFDYSTN